MSLHLNSSNRIEILQKQLAQLLLESPLPNPFSSEIILVQNMAMQRWLSLQLAGDHGIAANIEYPLPATWVWQFAQAVVNPDQELQADPLSREQAVWRIYGLLPQMLTWDEFAPLRYYLQDDEAGIKRFQVSQRIADVFDRYQYYRPEWIRAWSNGQQGRDDQDAAAWQPLLWKELIRDQAGMHRVAMIDALLLRLREGVAVELLPQRIAGFALSSLPPLLLQVLCELARHAPVHLYQHSPTDRYWADLRSAKVLERLRLERPREVDYYDTGNDLLTSWGRQGQAFQDLLLSNDALDSLGYEAYLEAGEDTLLHRLQQDMFNLHDGGGEIAADDSLRVMICHSALRECQVLHDQILHWMAADPTLKPEDILVMVPEISRYAPFVESAFRADDNDSRPFIPWNLSDIAVADEHPLVRMFLELLALPSWRFTFSQLSAVLDVPEVLDNFGIDQQMKGEIVQLLHDSAIRWGLDAEHRASLQLPAIEQNSWRHGIDRLLAGYALGDVALWNDIAPMSGASGSRAVALGRFCQILQRLDWWRQQLEGVRPASQWREMINTLLNELLGSYRDEDDKLQQIRDVLGELSVAGEEKISLSLLQRWLGENLSSRTVSNRFFSGGVTFCGMRPMRSVPFRVICVLGMNDLAFPRREDNISFDAMARHWRAGDPRKGDEDRYLLLETVLCARERLYMSYTGRSLKDNTPCQPSVLLQELLDFIDTRYRMAGYERASTYLTGMTTMQAFSWRNFLPSSLHSASFDKAWCRVAQSLLSSTGNDKAVSWPTAVLPVPAGSDEISELELERLAKFLKHPVRAFFNQRLKIRLPDDDSSADEEAFSLDHLQSWQIRDSMLQALASADVDRVELLDGFLQRATAGGALPHGSMAELSFRSVRATAESLLERLVEHATAPGRDVWVELPLSDVARNPGFSFRLHGKVGNYHPGTGLIRVTASRYKGKHLLPFWIDHLALCASCAMAESESSILIFLDQTLRLAFVPGARAAQQLADYVKLYQEGLRRPLPVFPEASFELVRYGEEQEARGLREAGKKLQSDSYKGIKGELDDDYIRLVLFHCQAEPLSNPELRQVAQTLYSLAFEYMEGV